MTKTIRCFAFLIFIALQSANAQNYFIKTIAGDQVAGYNGDGIAATTAELNNPIQTATDKQGNVYIADGYNSRIRKVDANGIITTFAGDGNSGTTGDGGAATAAEVEWPVALAFDDTGNLYIADVAANSIRKVNTKGIIITFAGNGTSGYSGDGGQATAAALGGPRGIAIDDSGNVYLADQLNYCVRKINRQGIISTFAGNDTKGYSGDGGPATDAQFDQPEQLAFDTAGNMYIDDLFNNVVRKINVKGIVTTFAGNGTACFSGDGGPATDAMLNGPIGIATDIPGNVFITDNSAVRIRMVDKSGTITTIAGTGVSGHLGDGGPALSAELDGAIGLNTDTANNIYISEYVNGNNDIRKLGPCGSALTFNPSANPALCSGQSVVLTVSGGISYQWSPATGLNTTTGDSVIASPTATTTYSVMPPSNACGDTGTIVVTVIQSPNTPTFYQHGDTLISSSLHDNQWYRNDTLLMNDTSQHLIITALGQYRVVVNNEANGCSATSDSMRITQITGINQLTVESGQVTVYPNPFSNQLTIISKQLPMDEVDITDELGQVLLKVPLGGFRGDINLSDLTSGMYFITVINKMGRAVVLVAKQN